MKKALLDAVKSALFQQYKKSMPNTVAAIEEVMLKGKKPQDITKLVFKRHGCCELTHHLTLVARHIYERINN